MKNYFYVSVFVCLLFSCKGNGQNTNASSKNDRPNPESNFVFSGDYNDLLTLEMASQITGFEASKATKLHTMKGMIAETLRYFWENGREEVIKKSASKRERVAYPRTDLVQIKWVDGEADMESFSDFIDLEKYPELTEVNGVGESAYWNPKKNHLEVYYNGISFSLQVDISNDESLDKEKTIALAKQIIEEKMK
ncbi:hypothetical protein LX77_03360 [Gelidibacter algens]|uniref:Uncharacterized protein n=1 Tax=Gelidibacter algens TaxID=49280 RepID=A0A1A7R0H6_9FLAO|nr:hypothetical protein [Gelidibacter algens]OBX24989.1 hypothetical protein A9996_12385 [Gelidibacter algens]RAJ19839.1 hypothetical protein LX77_03360 [Gelidibacter algens]